MKAFFGKWLYQGKERDISTSNWTWREWASLIIHVAFGLIPLVYGTVSAWNLWFDMFGEPIISIL